MFRSCIFVLSFVVFYDDIADDPTTNGTVSEFPTVSALEEDYSSNISVAEDSTTSTPVEKDPTLSSLIVNTTLGAVRGVRATDGDYTMYLGIPYAQVNRSNPFGVSTPLDNYRHLFEANNKYNGCPELRQKTIQGSLDCLNLNVYSPITVHDKKPLPVLVWIYGGGFLVGSTEDWNCKQLMKHDLIFVTFNYRSGPYGFMCLGTPDVPGNQALKDQALALRWIKDNIRAFGGDDENMTLYGYSSGSALTHFHLLYNKDRLFNKYILQSGVALGSRAIRNKNESIPLVLAEKIGFKTTNLTEALGFLTEQSEMSVMHASELAEIEYAPCVEDNFNDGEAFITEHPVNVHSNYNNVTVVIGYTDDEYYIKKYSSLKNVTSLSDFDGVIKKDFEFYLETDNSELLEAEVTVMRNFYSGDETDENKIKRSAINFTSDYYFCESVERATENLMQNGAKVYKYLFTYVSERRTKRMTLNLGEAGAMHTDELIFIFPDVNTFSNDLSPQEQRMANVLTTLFYNFANCGNPTPSPTELLPVEWLPVTNDTLHYLRIDSTLSMGTRPFNRRMAFWELMFMTNKKYGCIKGFNG